MATAARLSRSHSAAPAVNDLDLVVLAQNGDESAFTELYSRHRPRVRIICLRILRNAGPARAEELEQDAWLNIWRKLSTFRGESQFSTWLYRVAANTCLMNLRRNELHTVSYEDVNGDADADMPRWEPSDGNATARGIVAGIDVATALVEIAPGYRQAVVLHDILGLEHQESARVTGKSVGNSKSQVHKGREALARKLAPAS